MDKKKILIVEDDPAMAHVLQLKFEHSGYEVVIATEGQKALECVRGNGYELIVLDLIMPGIDGFKFLELFREHDKRTPVLVLTNLQQDEDKNRIEELGISGYFIKSQVSLQQIIEECEKILAGNK